MLRPAARPRVVAPDAAALLLLAALLALPTLLTLGRFPGRSPSFAGNIDLGPAGHNCRFWGMVGHDYGPGTVEDQLRGSGLSTLRTLGGVNRDGWAFASYPSDSTMRRILGGPLIRRGRPPADQPADPNFDSAVDEILRMSPRASLGHVRIGTSGHFGLPDPHPFLHRDYAFAHNGDVSIDLVNGLIENEDAGYLQRYPPEYVNGNIDSEIYFLWLMCHRETHQDMPTAEALRAAVALLAPLAGGSRLNFVLTQGDTLYALRCCSYDMDDPVRYFPDDVSASSFWIAASQPMGTEGGRWGVIPANTLAVFVPGVTPAFYPIDPQGSPDPVPAVGPSWIGRPRPNPSRGGFEIPVFLREGPGDLDLEIHNAQGDLVYRDHEIFERGATGTIAWSGRDARDRPLPAGVYFCRVRAGGKEAELRLVTLR